MELIIHKNNQQEARESIMRVVTTLMLDKKNYYITCNKVWFDDLSVCISLDDKVLAHVDQETFQNNIIITSEFGFFMDEIKEIINKKIKRHE